MTTLVPNPSCERQSRHDEEGQISHWRHFFDSAKRIGSIILATVGPGGFVAVGYMDPGNWATDLQAGAQFNYSLLFIVLLSGLIAIVLQSLCIRLGIVTGKDLPQLCKKEFHPAANFVLWILAELAIIATDLAEVIGAALALKLLFGIPVVWGVLIMGLDVLIVLFGWNQRYLRIFEMFIFVLILGVGVCFLTLLTRLNVNWGQALLGFVPSEKLVSSQSALYTALGILGATVMPHNLYLHSSLVHFKSPAHAELVAKEKLNRSPVGSHELPQNTSESVMASDLEVIVTPPTNILAESEVSLVIPMESSNTLVDTIQPIAVADDSPDSHDGIRNLSMNMLPLNRKCLQHLNVDSAVSLTYATVVNSFILITAASAFYTPDDSVVIGGIQDAYDLLWQMLGKGGATIFAVGLFFSGQCSTITGTLAGQVVMEGFLGGEDTLARVDDGHDDDEDDDFLVADSNSKASLSTSKNRDGLKTPKLRSLTESMAAFFKRNIWARRLVTRGFAIIPALIVTMTQGDDGIDMLLVLSQVVLGILLPFAVWPLVYFTSSRRVMTVRYGKSCAEDTKLVVYANSWLLTSLAILIASAITSLNLWLLVSTIQHGVVN